MEEKCKLKQSEKIPCKGKRITRWKLFFFLKRKETTCNFLNILRAEMTLVLYKIIHMCGHLETGSQAIMGPSCVRLFVGLGWGVMKPNQVMPVDRHSPQLSLAHTILFKWSPEIRRYLCRCGVASPQAVIILFPEIFNFLKRLSCNIRNYPYNAHWLLQTDVKFQGRPRLYLAPLWPRLSCSSLGSDAQSPFSNYAHQICLLGGVIWAVEN